MIHEIKEFLKEFFATSLFLLTALVGAMIIVLIHSSIIYTPNLGLP